MTTTEAETIRRTILEVIDDANNWRVKYDFWNPDETVANDSRLDFCDEVQRRLTDLIK